MHSVEEGAIVAHGESSGQYGIDCAFQRNSRGLDSRSCMTLTSPC